MSLESYRCSSLLGSFSGDGIEVVVTDLNCISDVIITLTEPEQLSRYSD
jgi:hypothetical protein